MIIVFTTTDSREEADELARGAVKNGHAGCVQIIAGVESVYKWKDRINVDSEFLLLIKTTAEKYRGLEEFLKAAHSYEVPEIVSVSAADVSAEYLAWLEKSVG